MVGVRKPCGMTSHDVVNACRRIFGEKRIGHAGTLDPMAEGVLLVLVGPAARLNAYLETHDKRYVARIVFGAATDTDDAQGRVLRTAPVPAHIMQPAFAQGILAQFLGEHMQVPPAYSAIKQAGQKAYEAARKGTILDLKARPIVVHAAELVDVAAEGSTVFWDVAFSVSKGTYIRALARDIGRAAGSEAHLGALVRQRIGVVGLEDCVTLETLAQLGVRAALDPVYVMGTRFAYAEGAAAHALQNGNALSAKEVCLHEALTTSTLDGCSCTSNVCESTAPPHDGERVLMLADNCVKAVYVYNAQRDVFMPDCVFSKGIVRGSV